MRAIFEISPESGDLVDWVADEAVSIEPVSRGENSLQAGKRTGNSLKLGPILGKDRPKTAYFV